MSRIALFFLALVAGCGVGTYRTAPARGELQVRLVANGENGDAVPRWFGDDVVHLEREVFLSAAHVREVQLEEFPDGAKHIVLYFDEAGTRRLARVTRANNGRRLAIVVDGRVAVAPTIRGPIADGAAHVTVENGDIDEIYGALTRTR